MTHARFVFFPPLVCDLYLDTVVPLYNRAAEPTFGFLFLEKTIVTSACSTIAAPFSYCSVLSDFCPLLIFAGPFPFLFSPWPHFSPIRSNISHNPRSLPWDKLWVGLSGVLSLTPRHTFWARSDASPVGFKRPKLATPKNSTFSVPPSPPPTPPPPLAGKPNPRTVY